MTGYLIGFLASVYNYTFTGPPRRTVSDHWSVFAKFVIPVSIISNRKSRHVRCSLVRILTQASVGLVSKNATELKARALKKYKKVKTAVYNVPVKDTGFNPVKS